MVSSTLVLSLLLVSSQSAAQQDSPYQQDRILVKLLSQLNGGVVVENVTYIASVRKLLERIQGEPHIVRIGRDRY